MSADLVDRRASSRIRAQDAAEQRSQARGELRHDSEVVVADIISSNGIVHILDSILLPPGVSISDFVTTVPTQILEEEEQNGFNEVAEGEDQSQTSNILAEAGDEESKSSGAGDGKGIESAAAPVATSDVSGSKSCKPATSCLLGLAFGLAFLVN